MIRRRAARLSVRLSVRLSILALAAVAVTGCTTFSDSDAVARVGDVELSGDEFAERTAVVATAQGQNPDAGDPFRVEGDTARITVANWIALQLAAGEGVLEQYANGADDVGVACVFAFPAADVTTAEALIAELEAGADWDDVVAREAPATIAGGRQQCFAMAGQPDFAQQVAGMSPDDPYRVLDGQPPYVVRAQTELELLGFDLLNALTETDSELASNLFAASNDSDVFVDPRIGVFNASDLSVVAVN